jgi:hypothetical protein
MANRRKNYDFVPLYKQHDRFRKGEISSEQRREFAKQIFQQAVEVTSGFTFELSRAAALANATAAIAAAAFIGTWLGTSGDKGIPADLTMGLSLFVVGTISGLFAGAQSLMDRNEYIVDNFARLYLGSSEKSKGFRINISSLISLSTFLISISSLILGLYIVFLFLMSITDWASSATITEYWLSKIRGILN